MKTTVIALISALVATPAMACTDWKAVAAFDESLASYDKIILGGGILKYQTEAVQGFMEHYTATMQDKKDALADKCQENAR